MEELHFNKVTLILGLQQNSIQVLEDNFWILSIEVTRQEETFSNICLDTRHHLVGINNRFLPLIGQSLPVVFIREPVNRYSLKIEVFLIPTIRIASMIWSHDFAKIQLHFKPIIFKNYLKDFSKDIFISILKSLIYRI